jgi:hypothetical protein
MPINATLKTRDWSVLVILTVLVVYAYVFMEWLFHVTKPSFMSLLGFSDSLQVLMVAPIPFIVLGVAVLILFWIPYK